MTCVAYSPCLLSCIEYTKYIGEALESYVYCDCVRFIVSKWLSCYDLYLIVKMYGKKGMYIWSMNFTCNTILLGYSKRER